VLHGAALGYTAAVPTSFPRHSITETPALAAVLEPLRRRLGSDTPSLAELVARGARSALRELEARDRARAASLDTFVERLRKSGQPDFDEVRAIRHTTRQP